MSGGRRSASLAARPARRTRTAPLTFADVRALGRALPEVEESTSYGTPALKVRGKLMARLKEDSETLVLRSDFLDREALIQVAPDLFFFTDHYRDYPWVLVRLASIERDHLAELLADAWRRVAPKALIKRHDAARSEGR